MESGFALFQEPRPKPPAGGFGQAWYSAFAPHGTAYGGGWEGGAPGLGYVEDP
jgi:hypothetical protein